MTQACMYKLSQIVRTRMGQRKKQSVTMPSNVPLSPVLHLMT